MGVNNGCSVAKYRRLLDYIGSVCRELVRWNVSAASDNPSGIVLYDDFDFISTAGTNCYSYCISNYLSYVLAHREVEK